MKYPDFSYEVPLWNAGHTVVGIDEVGRGAFAGPVGVGGVIFDPDMSLSQQKQLLELGIHDSKKLTQKKREYLSGKIKELAYSFMVSFIDVDVINEIGIGKAAYEGMRQVANKLSAEVKNPFILIDAFTVPGLPLSQKGIVRGDSLSISIAAASIVAKVERDRCMEELSSSYPYYLWEDNRGYGTLKHRMAIKKYGQTVFHREAFCRNI